MNKTQIVVAYDYSVSGNVALERGLDIACRDPQSVYLHFVTALAGGESYQRADAIHDDLLTRLRALLAERQPASEIDLFVYVRIGAPATEILRVAEEVGADLVIVGSHDRGRVGRLLLGSVSQEVLHSARCPVMVARTKGYGNVELQKVVEVEGHGPSRESPHRYHYTSAVLTRPDAWPLP
jgi:nucleotide-binding universal stress UspA family protein